MCPSVFGSDLSEQMDWKGWTDILATLLPDITLLDFFLWDYVKDKVYCTPFCDVSTLIARITEAVESVTLEMFQITSREIGYRLDMFRATNGAHVEIY